MNRIQKAQNIQQKPQSNNNRIVMEGVGAVAKGIGGIKNVVNGFMDKPIKSQT